MIIITGQTATGKTKLALDLAKKHNGELINFDSRQIYKYLTAGTSKPRGAWTAEKETAVYSVEGIACHLVDFLDPKHSYDAGKFISGAENALKSISAKGKLPIFAGGSGFYLQAFWNGLDPLPEGNPAIRTKLQYLAGTGGKEELHAKLAKVDPLAAQNIPAGNIQRVIRAIEVYELTGMPISQLWSRKFHGVLPTHKARFVVLDCNKALLHGRIKNRTHESFAEWTDETKNLLDKGYPQDCPGLKSLGYPQIIDFLEDWWLHHITGVDKAYTEFFQKKGLE